MIVAQKLWSNAVKFNSKRCHFRKKEAKITKIKAIFLQEGEPRQLGAQQSAADFERAEVLGPDNTRLRAPLHPSKINRR